MNYEEKYLKYGGRIVFGKQSIPSFDRIPKRYAENEACFVFVNKGNAPIIISKIKSSCGCTVPTYSKKPILPGEKGEINVRYATNRVGAISKTITVLSNASEVQKPLKIKGKVLNNTSI